MRDTVAYLQSFARFPFALRASSAGGDSAGSIWQQAGTANALPAGTQATQAADFSSLNAVLDEIGRGPR